MKPHFILSLLAAALGACAPLPLVASSSSTADATAAASANGPVQVGVYYFPGWQPYLAGMTYPETWAPIRAYPDRMPLKGEYDDTVPSVMRQQLDEMRDAGISFVAFDVYTGPHGSERLQQGLTNYMAVAKASDPKLALLWANHDKEVTSIQDWDNVVSTWINKYFLDPRYFRVNNKPVIIVFSPNGLDARAASFGTTTAELLSRAQGMARHYGIPGIIFVGGGGPQPDFIRNKAKAEGYAALTDYNMGTIGYPMPGTGYQRVIAVYRKYWEAFHRDGTLPVVLPITTGWSRDPWGGSKEGEAMSTPSEFGAHVTEALHILDLGKDPLSRIGVICCWNEYGEGAILEPTQKYKNYHLKALAQALKDNQSNPGSK